MSRDDLARLLWDAVWGCVWQVSDHLAWEKLPERFKERWRAVADRVLHTGGKHE